MSQTLVPPPDSHLPPLDHERGIFIGAAFGPLGSRVQPRFMHGRPALLATAVQHGRPAQRDVFAQALVDRPLQLPRRDTVVTPPVIGKLKEVCRLIVVGAAANNLKLVCDEAREHRVAIDLDQPQH